MSVRIITDSASDMSPAEHPALRVLPLSVTFGTDVYMDGVDIDHQRFYEMLVERDELPKTGQVNPYAFSQAIAEVREAGDEAVIITVGAKLSGTNQSARTALAEAPGGDVFVVDSNNVTLGERVLVEYALRLVDEGRSAAQIAAVVEAVRDRVVVIGLLETLEYLVRGGRLSAAAGAVGTLLNVKPVVAVEDGLIVQLGKARGSKNGRNLLNQKVEKAGGIDWKTINRRAAELLTTLNLNIDVTKTLGSYSVAVQQMIAIARAVDVDAKVLILDEPTSSLDEEETQRLFAVVRKLKAQGLGVIFVSHFLDQIYELCDRITVLRNGELVGAYAAAKKLDMLACVGGELAQRMAEAARMMGMDEDRIQVFSDYQQVLDRMGGALEKHDVVLVKGSRFVELDRFVEGVC